MMLIFVFSTASHTKAGGSMGQFMSKMNKSPTKWINESTWKECFQLSSSISAFAGLCSNITVNSAFWNKFSASENPFKFLENSSVVTGGMMPYQLNVYLPHCNLLLCILLAETIQLAEAIVILRVRSLTITGKILSRIEGEWTTMGYKIEDFHLVIELKVDNKQRIEIIKFVETVTYQTVDLFLEKGEYVHYVPLYWPKKSLFSFPDT